MPIPFPRPSRPSVPAAPARKPVSQGQPHPGFCLLDAFTVFFTAMSQARRQLLSGSAEASSGSGADVRQQLLTLLKAQGEAARKAEAAESYAEVQYLSAVFADEVFLDLVWPGRAAWAAEPLEQTLFGTHSGKDEVFEHLDALLARGVGTDLDLAKTYLLALSLGFRGRYRGGEEASHLTAYREQLYRGIYGTAPGTLPGSGRLFPEAYLSTASQGARRKLPALRGWVALFLSALVLYGIYSYALWERATAEISDAVARVLSLP
jgi:type VI secretion system protein ImpK